MCNVWCCLTWSLFFRIFLGMRPFVVISDVDLVKEITVKHFDKFVNRFVSDCMWFQYFYILSISLSICLI